MTTKEQNKLIWSVAAFTSSVIMLLIIIAFSCVAIFAPRAYADFVYAVGFKNSSLKSYEYNYNKTQDINDLYLLLSKSIILNNSDYIISAYETLEALEDYEDFIEYVEKRNFDKASSKFAMIFVANEDNYLKGEYVEALYKHNKERAFTYAYNDLVNSDVAVLSDRINFVLGSFIAICDSNDAKYFTEEVINEIVNYYNELVTIFDSEFAVLENADNRPLNKYYLSLMGYKVIEIVRGLNKLDDIITPTWDTQAVEAKADFIASQMDMLTA